jgi:antitoxin component of RelBE/YafQ-DinJ toxin-antitoxin module
MKEEFTTISVKKDETYKKFIKLCKKIGLKKGDAVKMLMQEFIKNPKKILINNL